MAVNAKRKTIKLAASFTRLSPSRMMTDRLGTFNPCNTDVAAIASGGDIIPPSRKPAASEKSGISKLEIQDTAAEVKITSPNPIRLIGLFNRQKSFQEVFQAAAYNKGGRNIRNTRSGWSVIWGIPGIRLMSRPLITRKMG